MRCSLVINEWSRASSGPAARLPRERTAFALPRGGAGRQGRPNSQLLLPRALQLLPPRRSGPGARRPPAANAASGWQVPRGREGSGQVAAPQERTERARGAALGASEAQRPARSTAVCVSARECAHACVRECARACVCSYIVIFPAGVVTWFLTGNRWLLFQNKLIHQMSKRSLMNLVLRDLPTGRGSSWTQILFLEQV